jgi:N-acetylneuraminic acid mutarotase
MKKLLRTLLAVACFSALSLHAQWTQKAPISAARDGAVSWTINGKFYVVGGNGRSDLREYDPATNHWTVKAFIPQGVTGFAFGFVINGKGYLCGGVDMSGTYYGTLNEYDPATNQWTAKAPLPGNIVRGGGFSFSIGNKGYIGCGDDGAFVYADVYEYDAVADTWSQKGQFFGGDRSFPYNFSIGNKAYVGGGDSDLQEYNDLWEYDQAGDTWYQKADLPASPRQAAASFASATKGMWQWDKPVIPPC